MSGSDERAYVVPFEALSSGDVESVGGKNASLGEMIRRLRSAGVRVPEGFATTAQAYWDVVDENGIRERISERVDALHDGAPLEDVGRDLRTAFLEARLPDAIARRIEEAYADLGMRVGVDDPPVAVRSSATAEDLPEASFAGQQETFLNVRGAGALLDAVLRCMASLFTDRAIAYREEKGFDHRKVALSVGVQRMVRSDLASAGVMFSVDTETGFPGTVLIDGSWGLGEAVVSGAADTDAYTVFKPLLGEADLCPVISRVRGHKERKVVYSDDPERPTRMVETSEEERLAFTLTDDEALVLARWAVAIEEHYGRAMDIEWAKDGETGEFFIVQARPETGQAHRGVGSLRTYTLHGAGARLVSGLAIGDAIAAGPVCRLSGPDEGERFQDGDVLVTDITDPDWVPIMRRAAAVVTDHGGRTSHAAIVSRELGVPAVVGTGTATARLVDDQRVTVSCAEGDEGIVYDGVADFEKHEVELEAMPATRTGVMLNIANPAAALRWWRLPAEGVGLARMEFIISNHIRVHPMALVRFDQVEDDDARELIEQLTRGYPSKPDYFVEALAHGIARIAASRHPDPVIVRLSDFKTNEYAALIGGRAFEPSEENPMLGWRGASRYYHDDYREGFALECRAIRMVRERIGMRNVVVMVPFCRTLDEADKVLSAMADHGLVRGREGLQVYVMAEIPSNVILADRFAERFDGFSIGSNDLTQLVLGVDRDSDRLADLFDHRDPAVMEMISRLIATAHEHDTKVGLCGQAPSDDPSFARFLVEAGIDTISVSPDSFVRVTEQVAAVEGQSGEAPVQDGGR